MNSPTWFVFDVESIGLHGEAFAVAGVIIKDGEELHSFCHACPSYSASGTHEDRDWVNAHVPKIEDTLRRPVDVRDAFWREWDAARMEHPGLRMAAECLWPVEARFLAACISDLPASRSFAAPYPFYDIASVMLIAGMDPMETYPRMENEMPIHHPLADARQSARLLQIALSTAIAMPEPILTQTQQDNAQSNQTSNQAIEEIQQDRSLQPAEENAQSID